MAVRRRMLTAGMYSAKATDLCGLRRVQMERVSSKDGGGGGKWPARRYLDGNQVSLMDWALYALGCWMNG